MGIVYRKITDSPEKTAICEEVLRSLPEWFGVEKSLLEYFKGVAEKCFYAAFISEEDTQQIAAGFIALDRSSEYAAEVYVLGVKKEYQRLGIGRQLLELAEKELKASGVSYLAVKTLSGRVVYEPYQRTRLFYERMQFVPLMELPELWDAANPCLIMLKKID